MKERDALLADAAASTRKALHLINLTRTATVPRQAMNGACRSRLDRALIHLRDAIVCAEATKESDQ